MSRELLLIESDAELAESVRRAFGPAGFHVTTLAASVPASANENTTSAIIISMSVMPASAPRRGAFMVPPPSSSGRVAP